MESGNGDTTRPVVFVCWSGERSKAVAKALRWLLGELFPDVEVFYSDEIDKGGLWFGRVQQMLSRACAAILCLTPENSDSQWLHFEAGALSVSMKDHERTVLPYLLDVDVRTIANGPLVHFQATQANREDTQRLVHGLALAMGATPAEADEKSALCRERWSKLWQKMRDHDGADIESVIPEFQKFFRRKTFSEPLSDCSAQRWLARYDGARETLALLGKAEERVVNECSLQSCDLFYELLAAVDGYAMDIEATLLVEKRFERDAVAGQVLIEPPGAGNSCEKRRRRIRRLVGEMLDRDNAPIVPGAVRFRALETFAEKKAAIHLLRNRLGISKGKPRPSDDESFANSENLAEAVGKRGLDSRWALDRIAGYLLAETRPGSVTLDRAVDEARRELERVRAESGEVSFVPQHYALRLVSRMLAGADLAPQETVERLARTLDEIMQEVDRRDQHGRIDEMVREVRERAGILPA